MSHSRVSVKEFYELLKGGGEIQLIDVREPVEYAGEYLSCARNIPLSNLSKQMGKISKEKTAFLLCQTGSRASHAAGELERHGYRDTRIIEGGLNAWKEAKLPVEKGVSRMWSLERQVRFAAGGLVAGGIIFAWGIHPYFIFISLFVAGGLMFSAVTNTCGMAVILAKCPWNKVG